MTIMTTLNQPTHRFALGSAMFWLTVMAVVATGASWLVIAKVLGETQNTATLASGLLVGINWLAACAGAAMVAAVASKGGLGVVVAYFGGAAVRFLLNLLTIVTMSVVLEFELAVIVVALAAAYLPLLLVEVSFIGWFLWQQDNASKPSSGQGDVDVHTNDSSAVATVTPVANGAALKITEAVA